MSPPPIINGGGIIKGIRESRKMVADILQADPFNPDSVGWVSGQNSTFSEYGQINGNDTRSNMVANILYPQNRSPRPWGRVKKVKI